MSNGTSSSGGELVKASDGFDFPIQPSDSNQKSLDALSGSKYLPRVQLIDSNSKLCKEKGVKAGTYLLIRSNDSYDDLTNTFDTMVLARRAKAVRMGQAGIFSFFDPEHDEFKKIIDESEVRDSGCFYGPEYLGYLKNQKTWFTLLCASKTARRSSTDINIILQKFDASRRLKKAWHELKDAKVPNTDQRWIEMLAEGVRYDEEPKIFNPFVTFRSSIKRKSTYSWWGMDVTPCSTPFGVAPPADEIKEQVTKFLNPPKTDVETVQETKETKRAR
jgi:exonuclease III